MTDRYYAHNLFFDQDIPIVSMINDKVIYDVDYIQVFADYLRKRCKGGAHQNVIAIIGRAGSGKSNFAVNLGRAIDPDFNLDESYVYTASDLTRILKNDDGQKVILIDEGSITLNNLNTQKKDDVKLTIAFDSLRSYGMTYEICMPNLRHLNGRIQENHVDFLCKCPIKSPVPGYSPKGFINFYYHEYREWGKPYFRPIGTAIFDKLPPRIDKEYKLIKKAHQKRFIDTLPDGEE